MKKLVSTKLLVLILIILVVIVGIVIVVKVNNVNISPSTVSPTITPIPTPMTESDTDPLPLETSEPTPIPSSTPDLDKDVYKDVTYEVCAPIHESMPEYRFVAKGVTKGTDIWSIGYVMGLEVYDDNNVPILLKDFSENINNEVIGYHVYNEMMDTMGLHIVDVNFDGYKDVIILNNYAGAHGNTWYDCWLWDEEISSFVASNSFAKICNPSLDQDNKCIYSTGGSGADYWGGWIYRYIDGEFILTNELDANGYGLVEKHLTDGRMEIVREVQFGDDEQIVRNEQEYYKNNELWQLKNPRWYKVGGHHADQWLQASQVDPEIMDFSRLSDYFKNYDFEVSSNINQELYINTYELSGEYDLNGDGIKETIQAVLSNAYNVNSYVKVNDIIVELHTDNPTGEVKIIDLDSRDDYLELACFDDGPSGDPHYKFFRYNGEELLALDGMDSGTIMDGRGKFISWFSLGVNFKPQFYTSWKELVGNEFINRDHDVKQYIGEAYKLSGSGFFVPLDEAPENYHEYMTWERESMRDFETTTTQILEIYSASTLFIEFEDGQKGLLYFWIGD